MMGELICCMCGEYEKDCSCVRLTMQAKIDKLQAELEHANDVADACRTASDMLKAENKRLNTIIDNRAEDREVADKYQQQAEQIKQLENEIKQSSEFIVNHFPDPFDSRTQYPKTYLELSEENKRLKKIIDPHLDEENNFDNVKFDFSVLDEIERLKRALETIKTLTSSDYSWTASDYSMGINVLETIIENCYEIAKQSLIERKPK